MNKIFAIAITILFTSLATSCWRTEPTGNQYGNFLRVGEDPGRAMYTNYQYVTNITIQGTELLRVQDPDGDDNGAGNLSYPANYEAGVLDIHEVVVSADSTNVYLYIAFQDRAYVTVDSILRSAGFSRVLVGAYFGQANATPGALTNLGMYSPNDGTHGNILADLSIGVAATNVAVQYGAGFIGTTYPILGALMDGTRFGSTSGGGVLTNITTNELITTSVTYPNISTVFAVKIPRGAWLSAGSWKFSLITYGWEDYGLSTCYPGNNGYFRDITGYSGAWTFGANGSGNLATTRKCADMLITTATRQSNVLVSRKMDAADFFSISLP